MAIQHGFLSVLTLENFRPARHWQRIFNKANHLRAFFHIFIVSNNSRWYEMYIYMHIHAQDSRDGELASIYMLFCSVCEFLFFYFFCFAILIFSGPLCGSKQRQNEKHLVCIINHCKRQFWEKLSKQKEPVSVWWRRWAQTDTQQIHTNTHSRTRTVSEEDATTDDKQTGIRYISPNPYLPSFHAELRRILFIPLSTARHIFASVLSKYFTWFFRIYFFFSVSNGRRVGARTNDRASNSNGSRIFDD